MKKNLLILAAATAVAFAACNGGNKEGSYTQAQVDSMQKAQTDSIEAAMKAQTDSTIAAQAQRTADSLRLVNDSLTTVASAKSTTTTTTVVKKSGNKGNSTTTTKQTKVEPKPVDKTDPSYRPGAKSSTSNSPDGQKEAPKSVSDRPGAK